MILLEVENKVVEDVLTAKFEAQKDGARPDAVDVSAADFDGVLYHISNPDGDKSIIRVSISLNFYHELSSHGADDVLKRIYGNHFSETTESSYNVSLVYDLNTLPDKTQPIVRDASRLKRNCFAAMFERYFEAQEKGGLPKRAVIHFRPDETMYLESKSDRVTVIFSTIFKDMDDVIIGKVFMQEFKEGMRASSTAPSVLFSHKDPPLELKNTAGAATGDNIGYITFVLYPRHIGANVRDNTIDLIHTFRNYLHYHIKCSKAYLHSRMRVRTVDLVKVLERAKPEKKTEKKTITGRTFQMNQ